MHSTFKSKVGDAKISSSSTYPLLVTAEINFFSSFSPYGAEIKTQKCCCFQILFSEGGTRQRKRSVQSFENISLYSVPYPREI